MEKYIVKDKWLSFLLVSPSLEGKLQEIILSGRLDDEKNIPAAVYKKLTPDQNRFVLEKSLQVSGKLSQLLQSLQKLSTQAPADPDERLLWQERLFLKGFALSRLNDVESAEKIFQNLPDFLSPRIKAERALRKLNSGEFLEAVELFQEALQDPRLEDFYGTCTILGGLSLALIYLGEFRSAERCIQNRQHLLRLSPCPPLEFGTKLYEILLCLEGNQFVKASELLGRTLMEEKESINAFFLTHLKLRLSLERNELHEAANLLEELKSQKIPVGALNVGIEEIEWNLRSGKHEEAILRIQAFENSVSQKNDSYVKFRLSVLKARALYHQKSFAKAFQEITAAITEAERRHYSPGLTWALFHGAGIAHASGHLIQGKLFLHQGERLSQQLRLRSRFACFSYMAEVAESKQSGGIQLLNLVRRKEIGPELEYYLNTYNLLNEISVEVSSRDGRASMNEPALRRQLFDEPGLFWFQSEETVFANFTDGKSKFVEFSGSVVLLAAFRLFWNAFQFGDEGISLKDLHQVRSTSTYREDLHLGATKMLIARLRSHLGSVSLKISYNRDTGLYSLASDLAPYTVLSKIEKPHAVTGNKRENEILARIAREPFVSTRILCDEFGVTRQALHPFLKSLSKKKKIRTVRRGPISGYIAIRPHDHT